MAAATSPPIHAFGAQAPLGSTDQRPTRPAARESGRWSWRLGKLFGIDVYAHATFVLLLAWVAFSYLAQGEGLWPAIEGTALVVAVFGVVVLHELGHALTARRFGIRTLDITLLPIGGVARLQRMPEEPIQELLVAFAGPAVNVVLAALLAIVIVIIGGTLDPGALQVVGGPFLVKLLWINVSIALFDLLPAFPMDGGRVLRAILAFRLDYARATELAARIGQGMAVLFGIAGLFLNPMLLLIALFVWVSAGQEAAMVRLRTALSGIAVREAMITNFKAVAPTDSLGRVAALMLAGFQHDFPVIEGQQLAGVLTRNDLIKGLAEGGPSVPVGRLMRTSFATAEPTEMLEDALGPLQEHPEGPVWVLEGDLLLGMLTLQNIGELIAMHDAVREPRRS